MVTNLGQGELSYGAGWVIALMKVFLIFVLKANNFFLS